MGFRSHSTDLHRELVSGLRKGAALQVQLHSTTGNIRGAAADSIDRSSVSPTTRHTACLDFTMEMPAGRGCCSLIERSFSFNYQRDVEQRSACGPSGRNSPAHTRRRVGCQTWGRHPPANRKGTPDDAHAPPGWSRAHTFWPSSKSIGSGCTPSRDRPEPAPAARLPRIGPMSAWHGAGRHISQLIVLISLLDFEQAAGMRRDAACPAAWWSVRLSLLQYRSQRPDTAALPGPQLH